MRGSYRDQVQYIDGLEKELEKIHMQANKLSQTIPNIDMIIVLTPIAQIKKVK